jgi:hypothetical protein
MIFTAKIIYSLVLVASIFSLAADEKKIPAVLCPLKPDPPPVIDGSITEWFKLPGENEVEEKNILYGKNNWKNEKDLSGFFKFCWDKNYLYIMAEVVDDIHKYNNVGKDIWKNDSVMIEIDTAWKPGIKGKFHDKQFQIAFGAGNLENSGDPIFDILPEFHIFYPKNVKKNVKIDVAAKRSEHGYNIEARIPWKLLEVKPVKGMIFGIDFHLSDSDESNDQETMSYLYPHTDKRIRLRHREKLVPVKLGNTSGK